jgi:hypothetical protein
MAEKEQKKKDSNNKVERNVAFLFIAFFCGISAVLGWQQDLSRAKEIYNLETFGIRTKGRVIDLNEKYMRGRGAGQGYVYDLVVSYKTIDSKGAVLNVLGSLPPRQIGDKVDVLYLAKDPQNQAIIDEDLWSWIVYISPLFLDVLLACFTALTLTAYIKPNLLKGIRRFVSFLDMFRPRPKKQCTSCSTVRVGLNDVYSGSRGGDLTDQLCEDCLASRLKREIRGRKILFIEPLVMDGYCYFPFGEDENKGVTEERVRLALSSLARTCIACAAEPHYLWMPFNDLDEEEMNKQEGYPPLPQEPSRWQGTVSLCDTHITARLRDYLKEKKGFFGTFRFPAGANAGYYWS